MDAVERRVDVVGTPRGRCVHAIIGKFGILGVFRGDPQRADKFIKRCTEVVASPFGVTGA